MNHYENTDGKDFVGWEKRNEGGNVASFSEHLLWDIRDLLIRIDKKLSVKKEASNASSKE